MRKRYSGKVLWGIATAFALIHIGVPYDKSFAETPVKTWVARYNGTANKTDYPSKMVTDTAGNIYVTGYSCRNSSSFGALCGMNADADYATIKYDSNGNQLWEARYDSGGDDSAASLFVDNSGNVYVTGTSANPVMGNDFVTIKYDSAGRQLWMSRYNGGIFENAAALYVDSFGNVYVTGKSAVRGSDFDYATVKYDPSGRQLWAARYRYLGIDAPSALLVDGLGNVYVTGYSCHDAGCASTDYATVKYDSEGNQLWAARYGIGGYSGAQAMTLDSLGNLYVTGSSSNGTDLDYTTIKYSTAGDQLWVARYDNGNNDHASAISLDHSGNVIITGASYGSNSYDYATVKYDPSGRELWKARYDSGGCRNQFQDDYARTVFVDGVDNVYVVGYQTGFDIDYNAVKYDADGHPVWIAKYAPQSHGYGVDLSMDESGNFYVIGGSWNGSNYDYATIKYLFSSEAFSFDKEAPTTHYVRSGSANNSGWDNTDVEVTLSAEDTCNTSGIREIHYQVGLTPDQTSSGATAKIHLAEEGINTLRYYAVDQKGNTEAVHTMVVKIDKTPPTIISTQAPLPNLSGWNSSDVTVQFSATDSLSGGVHCTVTSVPITQEGADQSAETTCADMAGNSAHVVKKVNIDRTAPRLIFESGFPSANGAGWNKTDVSVPFTFSDLSGIAATDLSSPLVLSEEGRGITKSITLTDRAGNSAAYTSPSFNIDKTPPIIASTQSVPPNEAGWNNGNVTVYFSATDSLSGGVQCTAQSVEVTTEGENQSATTTCTDLAGNSATGLRKINIDKTAPVLTLPNLASSYPLNSPLTLSFGATDRFSGIESISGSLNGVMVTNGESVVLNERGTQTFSLTAVDRAGNVATESRTFNVQIEYQFLGFLPPLTAGSRSVFHLGSVIPVKFKLLDLNGDSVPGITAHLSLRSLPGSAPAGDPVSPPSVSGADSGDLFRYEGGHYMYNLDTRSLSPGLWEVQATLEDGSTHSIQIGLR